jgi:hypothetical protein
MRRAPGSGWALSYPAASAASPRSRRQEGAALQLIAGQFQQALLGSFDQLVVD